MSEKIPFKFVEGLGFQELSPKAPESIIANVDVNVERFYMWCKENMSNKGFAKITIRKSSKNGKLYATLNNFNVNMPVKERKEMEMVKELHGATPMNTPDTDEPESEMVDSSEDIRPEDIPF